MTIQKFENVQNMRINGKSIHVVTFTIIQKIVTHGCTMVNCTVKAGIKKVSLSLINTKMSCTTNLINLLRSIKQ